LLLLHNSQIRVTFLNILFSKIFVIYALPSKKETGFYTVTKTGKTVALYILMFNFLQYRTRDDKKVLIQLKGFPTFTTLLIPKVSDLYLWLLFRDANWSILKLFVTWYSLKFTLINILNILRSSGYWGNPRQTARRWIGKGHVSWRYKADFYSK